MYMNDLPAFTLLLKVE